MKGTITGAIKGDTRSLDDSSYWVRPPPTDSNYRG